MRGDLVEGQAGSEAMMPPAGLGWADRRRGVKGSDAGGAVSWGPLCSQKFGGQNAHAPAIDLHLPALVPVSSLHSL